MELFEKIDTINGEYLGCLKKVIELGHKETTVKLEMERARAQLASARSEMWALEQEAKEIKVCSLQ